MKYAYDNEGQEIARALLLVNLLAELRFLIDPRIRNNAANEFGVDTDSGFVKLGTIEDERVELILIIQRSFQALRLGGLVEQLYCMQCIETYKANIANQLVMEVSTYEVMNGADDAKYGLINRFAS